MRRRARARSFAAYAWAALTPALLVAVSIGAASVWCLGALSEHAAARDRAAAEEREAQRFAQTARHWSEHVERAAADPSAANLAVVRDHAADVLRAAERFGEAPGGGAVPREVPAVLDTAARRLEELSALPSDALRREIRAGAGALRASSAALARHAGLRRIDHDTAASALWRRAALALPVASGLCALLLGALLVWIQRSLIRPAVSLSASARRALVDTTGDVVVQDSGPAELRELSQSVAAALERLRRDGIALEAARRQAASAEDARAKLLVDLGRELRAPLHGALAIAEALAQADLPSSERRSCELLRGVTRSLAALADDVLSLARLEAGKLGLDRVEFDLLGAVEEVALLLAPTAQRKGLEIAVRLAPGTPRRVQGDPLRVRQVVQSLAANALERTQQGHVEIALAAGDVEDSVAVQVLDTSAGPLGDSGPGLALAELLAERMGGELRGGPRSEGRGACFALRLPLPGSPRDVPDPAAAELRDQRVLVVESQDRSRAALVEALTRLGARPVACAAGEPARALLEQALARGEPFQAALLDTASQTADNAVRASTLRAEPALAALGLVLLTRAGVEATPAQLALQGFDAQVQRPVLEAELVRALSALRCARPAPAALPAAESRERAHEGRVLLVEDNEVNQLVALGILEELGCAVELARDGREAVERFRAKPFDVVLMDLQLPVLDGFDAARAIRALDVPGARDVPILAISASSSDEAQRRAREAGASGFLPKPFHMNQLVRELARWLPVPAAGGGHARLEDLEAGALEQLRALERRSSPGLFHQVLTTYVRDAAARLAEIRECVDKQVSDPIARLAHSLKSASSQIGASALRELCGHLEELARECDGEVDDLHLPLARAELAFERLRPLLERALAA
jgi:CheY-like chemotaxis protein/HPt (histidine-containing phosphotransfer) domain-containing protein